MNANYRVATGWDTTGDAGLSRKSAGARDDIGVRSAPP